MRKSVIIIGAVAFGAVLYPPGPGYAQTPETRQMEKHEHGHVRINIAIDGSQLLIELFAPGADIVGFEHPARTPEDRAAVEKAEALLEQPATLIALPAEAGCRTVSAKVTVAGDEHGHEGTPPVARPHGHGHEHNEARHTEFRAEYALACTHMAALRRIGFPFFKVFPRTREIEATVIGASGQRGYEIAPDKPEIALERAS